MEGPLSARKCLNAGAEDLFWAEVDGDDVAEAIVRMFGEGFRGQLPRVRLTVEVIE